MVHPDTVRRINMKKLESVIITVDGIEYNSDDLSDNAKAQLTNIQFVDLQLQLNNELAVLDNSKNRGYTNALKNELNMIKVSE